jgi:tRNA(fMet)-specific endonuclease VapC
LIYLLDTNVWIAILRKKHLNVAIRYGATRPIDIRNCSVVVGELRVGCLKSPKPAVARAKLDALLAPIQCVAFDDDAADYFATIRHYLESRSTPIGPYDTQITAIALAHAFTLVTNNAAEFKRVPGLLLDDWQ